MNWAGVARAEPLVLVGIAPLVWFPRPWSGWLLLVVISLLWLLRWRATGRLSVRTLYDIPVVCLLACLPLSTLVIIDWLFATRGYFAVLHGLALVYALANALSTRAWVIRGTLATTVLVGGGVAVLGLVGTDWPTNKLLPLDPLYAQLPKLVRGVEAATPHGAFHPNEIGGAVTLLIPLALALLLAPLNGSRRGRLALRLGSGTVCALTMTLLILSQSRSAYVGAAVAIGVVVAWWLAFRTRSARVRIIGFGLLLLGISVVIWGVWRLLGFWSAAGAGGLWSLPGRIELWDRALSMLLEFPITGIGMGQFPLVLRTQYTLSLTPPGAWVPHAHNVLLQLALDLGIPGAVSMLLVLGAFLRALWRVARRSSDPLLSAIAVGLGASLTGFLVYGLTDTIYVGARAAIILWVVLGIGTALARVDRLQVAGAPPTPK
jgi:putative inorganic carbon (hco3(-)) transporter